MFEGGRKVIYVPVVALALATIALIPSSKTVQTLPLAVEEAATSNKINSTILIPKLVIAGAQKGGTTALQNILRRGRRFIKSKGKGELHFLDYKTLQKFNGTYLGVPDQEWENFLQDMEGSCTDSIVLALRREYQSQFPHIHDSTKITFEKSPSYFIHPYVPSLLKKLVPSVKVVIVVREPTSRAYSQWKMYHNRSVMQESFEYYVHQAILELKQKNLSTAPTLSQFTDPNLSWNDKHFQLPYSILERRSMQHHSPIRLDLREETLLYHGMYAQFLSGWMEQFELGKDLLVFSSDRFQQDHQGILAEIQELVELPPTRISKTILEQTYYSHKAEPMKESTQAYLAHFYKPYNEELLELMGEEWYELNIGKHWELVE